MNVWATPLAFLVFIPLVMMIGYQLWMGRRSRASLNYSSIQWMKAVSPTLRTQLRWLPAALFVLSLSCFIVALARPQRADSKVKKNVEGIDIVLVLDVSDSMAIEDLVPNRLEACKNVMKDFVNRRVSDRIAFVIFSGESYTRVPLTLDYGLLKKNISEVKSSRNIKLGTAIGVGLANAVARLRDSTAKSRVIVFLTDGENNTGTIDPETALGIAKGYGIRIYTIGAGIDGQAQLPQEFEDAFGRKVKRYVPIHSSVNDDLLGRMASDTGGKYYRATDTNGLKKVFAEIDRLEKTKVDVQQYTKYAELFENWNRWGLVLLLLSLLLGELVFRRVP